MICNFCKTYYTNSHACPLAPFDDEKTSEYVLATRCPSCRSLETEPFETHVDGTKHCLPCGAVFQ